VEIDFERYSIIHQWHQLGKIDPEGPEELKKSIVNEAEIVFSTLSSSALKWIADTPRPFDSIIIDEAAQALELVTLIPLLKYSLHFSSLFFFFLFSLL
jgi:superfamily I DNA and/or RNA helicase